MSYQQKTTTGGQGRQDQEAMQYGRQPGTRAESVPPGMPEGQMTGGTLEESLTGEMRLALHDFVQSANVCDWCADRCIDQGPEMAECIRLCRDVADLATQNVRFIARDSVYGPAIAETFASAAEECAQECARHPHDHCQECASTLRRAVSSTWELLNSLDYQGGPGQRQQSIGSF